MPVLVFDMDGVLVDTESVKIGAFRDAMAELCGGDEDALREISRYNEAHRGVPRLVKIRHVLGVLLGRPEAEERVAARYADLLHDRLPSCPTVPGVVEFLRSVEATRYVASSAPVAEIVAQLERHGLRDRFVDVFGAPTTKTEALRTVAARHPGAVRVFFGDAAADHAAAEATATPFIAVNPSPGLADQIGESLADFRDTDAVMARVRAAGAAAARQSVARPPAGGGGTVPVG